MDTKGKNCLKIIRMVTLKLREKRFDQWKALFADHFSFLNIVPIVNDSSFQHLKYVSTTRVSTLKKF